MPNALDIVVMRFSDIGTMISCGIVTSESLIFEILPVNRSTPGIFVHFLPFVSCQ